MLTLTDAKGFRVTGKAAVVTFARAGQQTVPFSIDGGFMGDSGADGPYAATLTQQELKPDGTDKAASASAFGTSTSIGRGWKAADFVDYVPTLQRMRDRMHEFAYLGAMSTTEETKLRGDLVGKSPNLQRFRDDVAALPAVNGFTPTAKARLDSLAQRRIGAGAAATPDPTAKPAPPGYDPVIGPRQAG